MAEFRRLVRAVLARFFVQNTAPAPAEAEVTEVVARLEGLVVERGLPVKLPAGAAGGMADDECAPLVARVIAGVSDPWLADAAKQLVKACFYPELTTCRDSFREMTRDGSCRRQETDRARRRVSGTHCVDCPHWTAFAADGHGIFLREHWRGNGAEFEAHRGVFLPEDFRALRRWLAECGSGA